ncbi:hypothetical protein AB0M42_11015 [Streptomyces sp. NPDC051784]|uniref:hypothetical protein n=1 Tax=Streptomyces sp. NPDC051784 TaxID=3155805 RepID=UPI003417E3AF
MNTTLTPARPPLRGPVQVLVRQHRWTLRITGALALLTVLGLIALALRSSHVAAAFEASGCSANGGTGRACDQNARDYWDSMNAYQRVFHYIASLLVAVPVFAGAYVAGPMIGRELESGAHRMSWTQSVSPARWLSARLATPAVLLVAATAVLAVCLHTAWNLSDTPYPSEWYRPEVFATTGTALPAYVLFALCTGALTGLLVRRTLPALALSAAVTGSAAVAFAAFRALLWPRATGVGQTLRPLENIWWVETGHVTSDGSRLPDDVCAGAASAADRNACMADHDITRHYLDYHPASHFWPLQLVETGILLTLAALALALAFRVLRRLHG